MDKNFETLVETTMKKFSMVGVDAKGVLVCDRNGLALTSNNVSNSPGPVARLAELATSLSGRRATVCLEHNENQVLIHQTEKTIVAVYTENAT